MPNNDGFDGERTIGAHEDTIDPDDCATMVIREVRSNEPTQQALEGRIKTIDRIIHDLEK